MGEMHDMYGRWDENGEFNPFDGEPDDDPVAQAGLTCCNCDARVVARRYPHLFCSDRCAEEAHTVRYARGVIRDGRILDPEVAEAVQIRVGMVLGGGYSKRERELSPELRADIVARDKGKCQVCGQPGDQIDHINEDMELLLRVRDINHPENLQLICDGCHRKKTLSTFKPLEPEHEPKAAELHLRIHSPVPLRESDDDVVWKTLWRTRASERSALVKEAREA
jgi:5-methylcytosine-specific restriction endonuclease McrA